MLPPWVVRVRGLPDQLNVVAKLVEFASGKARARFRAEDDDVDVFLEASHRPVSDEAEEGPSVRMISISIGLQSQRAIDHGGEILHAMVSGWPNMAITTIGSPVQHIRFALDEGDEQEICVHDVMVAVARYVAEH